MAKPKKIKDAVRLAIVLSKEQADRVAYMARKMGIREGRNITTSEAIRMAIEAAYPVPKQEQLKMNL